MESNPADACARLSSAMTDYIHDKWGVPARSMTVTELETRLVGVNVPADLAAEVRRLLDRLTQIRYGSIEVDSAARAGGSEAIRTGGWGSDEGEDMSRIQILLCLSITYLAGGVSPALAQPDSIAARVEAAHRLYEEDRLDEAISAYRDLLASGASNGYLRYNRGNALFRRGKLGPAILEYERALRYLPRFGDLRHNLEYARGLTADEVLRPAQAEGALGFVQRLHGLLNLRESLVCVVCLWWILSAAIILGWFLKCPDCLTIVRRVLLGLLLTGTCFDKLESDPFRDRAGRHRSRV